MILDPMSLNVVMNKGFAACPRSQAGCGAVGAFGLNPSNPLEVSNEINMEPLGLVDLL